MELPQDSQPPRQPLSHAVGVMPLHEETQLYPEHEFRPLFHPGATIQEMGVVRGGFAIAAAAGRLAGGLVAQEVQLGFNTARSKARAVRTIGEEALFYYGRDGQA